MRNLIVKTVGLSDVLRAALEPLADRIVAAFVYGSPVQRFFKIHVGSAKPVAHAAGHTVDRLGDG